MTRDSFKSLPEGLCYGFLRPEQINLPQPGLNPRTLDLEATTLLRDHRGRQTHSENCVTNAKRFPLNLILFDILPL